MRKRTIRIIVPMLALLMVGALVLIQRRGISVQYARPDDMTTELSFTASVEETPECLLLMNSENETSTQSAKEMGIVLDGMQVAYDTLDISQSLNQMNLDNYATVIVAFQDWSMLGQELDPLLTWVEDGGELMSSLTPELNSNLTETAQKIGILDGQKEYIGIQGLHIMDGCMIGSNEQSDYPFEMDNSLFTSLNVSLDDQCKVYVTSLDQSVPIIWSKNIGDGTVVIMNDIITDKYQRGFLALAYSLLGQVDIYPVMNASAFYLDDFPSPVPEGDSVYIRRDYGIDTATFYSSIWWPQILEWEETYGIYHTGMIIEKYSDQVSGTFEPNESTARFLMFGNMLLNNGGELGFHGYNHQPLCLEGVDDSRQFGTYKLWPTQTDMENSLTELDRFSKALFPMEDFTVYVPPSNILTESGEAALLAACPNIKVIASTYLKDANNIVDEQEFGIEDNGIIDTPRIVSGCEIDNYSMLSALSELNFQFVQSHFMHPDDVLDEDRGAAEGWEKMSNDFSSYLDWVYQSVPMIRNVTGSGMGAVTEAYSKLSMQKKIEGNILQVKLGGFSGEAYLLMRINEGEYVSADGCTCEEVANHLYLVYTQQDTFQIQLGE